MDGEKLWTAKFMQLLLIESVLQFGMYLTRPIISSYAISLGASMALAGFLAGMLATAALAIRPISGAVSDKLSKRSLLVVSCGLFAASALGCALCRSIELLGLFLALQGFAFAFKSTVVVSLASLVVPKKRVGTGVGLLGLAYTVSCAIGPAVGSAIGKAFGYSAVFAASCALLSLGFTLALLFRAPHKTQAPRTKSSVKSIGKDAAIGHIEKGPRKKPDASRTASKYLYLPALPLSIIAGFLMVAQGVTSSFILVVGEIRGIEGAPLYFLLYSLATLVARPLAGKASDALGVEAVATPMIIVAGIGMMAAAFIDSFSGIAIASVSMGVGQSSAYCAIQAESVRGVPENQLGRAANTFYIGPDLCMGLGPVAGGLVFQTAGPTAMFVFNAISVFTALLLFVAYAQSNRCSHKPANHERSQGQAPYNRNSR